jgi:hypothetical protein
MSDLKHSSIITIGDEIANKGTIRALSYREAMLRGWSKMTCHTHSMRSPHLRLVGPFMVWFEASTKEE